jgi:hypothetical protein
MIRKKHRSHNGSTWESFNNLASAIAALCGVFVFFQNQFLKQEIDRLRENIEASSLVGELIGSLTSDTAKQDIALLALDNALTSNSKESQEKREERYKELVAKIASNLLNRSLSSPLAKAGEDAESTAKKIEEETETARTILAELLGLKLDDTKTLIDEVEYILIDENTEFEEYKMIAARALRDYDNHGKKATAPTANAQLQITYSEQDSSPEYIEGDINAEGEQQRKLNVATNATAAASLERSENKAFVYLHYDDENLINEMYVLKETLESKDNWIVSETIKLVEPTEFNCAFGSDIRYFHKYDKHLAEGLKTILVNDSDEHLSSYVSNVRLIDLSNWEKASLVPERQLEIWIIAQGEACGQNRAKSALR